MIEPSLTKLSAALATGKTTSKSLVEKCLANALSESGEGSRVFTKLNETLSRKLAEAYDLLRASGQASLPFAGIPISVKDLFDIEGEVTTAGSRVFAENGRAAQDATVIKRLKQAGFILIGRTNMTEFAYSGLGLNPHFGTPLNPFDRKTGRISGGSSSGAAISVTDKMAFAGIGTDTGGSCRIPAALCGLVGYKPTANTIDQSGVFPLSFSLDSVGSLANDVKSVALLHSIMAQTEVNINCSIDVRDLHFGVPQSVVLDDLDIAVSKDFDNALERLSNAGSRITEIPMSCWNGIAKVNAKGGFTAAEAYSKQRDLIEHSYEVFDPRVVVRMLRGKEQSASDYIDLLKSRDNLIETFNLQMASLDALLFPTVPTVAPPLEPLEKSDELYGTTNLLMLRNPTTINMVDGCAISLPMNNEGELPTGLTVAAAGGQDKKLLGIALALEPLFKRLLL